MHGTVHEHKLRPAGVMLEKARRWSGLALYGLATELICTQPQAMREEVAVPISAAAITIA